MKIIFIIILIFISLFILSPNIKAAQLIMKNAISFSASDINNDGKDDLIILFNDGVFGVAINKSFNNTQFIFDDVAPLELSESDSLKTENSTNANETAINTQTSRIKLLSRNELQNFINDPAQKEPVKESKKAALKERADIKKNKSYKVSEKEISEKKDVNSLIIKEEIKITPKNNSSVLLINSADTAEASTKNIAQSKEKDKVLQDDTDLTKIYDIFLMDFVNKTADDKNSDFKWLEQGFRELLHFDLRLQKNSRIAPLELSEKISKTEIVSNNGIFIYGDYAALDKIMILTIYINNKNLINSIKLSEQNDNAGILSLVSKTSRKINEFLQKK